MARWGTGNAISGTWALDNIWNTMGISHLMLAVKGGAGVPIQPNTYVAYLITPGATQGNYLTPFVNVNSGNPTGISHISAYFRQATQQVPEPGSLTLLGVGIVAAACQRRVKNRKARRS